jgi:hypothetical protein
MNSVNFDQLFPGRNLSEEWTNRQGVSIFESPVLPLSRIRVDTLALQHFYETWKIREHSAFEDEVIDYAFNGRQCSPYGYWPFIVHHPTDLAVNLQKAIDTIRGISWATHQRALSTKNRIKSLIELNDDYDPIIDERNYTKLPERLVGSYIETFLSQFQARAIRARFVQLMPNEEIGAHVDYNPKYALKAHIPIYTNNDAVLGFNKHGEFYLAPGSAYIINTGTRHWAVNRGTEARIHLVVSLDGQEDL